MIDLVHAESKRHMKPSAQRRKSSPSLSGYTAGPEAISAVQRSCMLLKGQPVGTTGSVWTSCFQQHAGSQPEKIANIGLSRAGLPPWL